MPRLRESVAPFIDVPREFAGFVDQLSAVPRPAGVSTVRVVADFTLRRWDLLSVPEGQVSIATVVSIAVMVSTTRSHRTGRAI